MSDSYVSREWALDAAHKRQEQIEAYREREANSSISSRTLALTLICIASIYVFVMIC